MSAAVKLWCWDGEGIEMARVFDQRLRRGIGQKKIPPTHLYAVRAIGQYCDYLRGHVGSRGLAETSSTIH